MADAAAMIQPARGLRPWFVWGLGALTFFYAFFQRTAPSVMVDGMMRDFAVGAAVLGNLSAFYFYAYAALQLPIGAALDRWGPRRLLTLSVLIAAVGSMVLAWAPTLHFAYGGRLLVGIGSAVGFLAALKLANEWFPADRFAFLTGLTMFVGMAGGVGSQAPLALAVEAWGWRASIVGAGLAGLFLAVALWLVVRDTPAGDISGRGVVRVKGPGVLTIIGRAFRFRETWLLSLISLGMSGPMLAYGGLWGVPHMMAVHNLSRPEAAGMTSALFLGWALGSPTWGYISDRLGRRRTPMIMACVLSVLEWLALLWFGHLSVMLALAIMFAIGMTACAMGIAYAAGREHVVAETDGKALGGAINGVINTATVGSGALLQPVIGLFLDASWTGGMVNGTRVFTPETWLTALAILPLCAGIALIAAVISREPARPA